MSARPVIVRELRTEARRPSTLWLRVIGGAAAVLILAGLGWEQANEPGRWGQELFTALHGTLFLGIWIFGPALAADCLSRERREGTLGLLFLTPLTPQAVVVAKGLVHGLRAFGLLLAALPVMTTPFLLGGVTWQEAVMSALVNLGALTVALGAGLLASSRCREWRRALILAEVLGGLAFLGFILLQAFAVITLALAQKPGMFNEFLPERWRLAALIPAAGVLYSLNGEQAWTQIPRVFGRGGMGPWLWLQAGLLPLHAAVLWLAIRSASRRLARSLVDEPPSARQAWWFRTFCTPQFWQEFFRVRMKSSLERNPVGWLHQRVWSARLSKWAWCFLVVLVESMLASDASLMVHVMPFGNWQVVLALALMLGMSVSAAGSFRVERENGMLELMLVAPLRVNTILFGRLFSIWWQFLPAVAAFSVVWFALSRELVYRPPGIGCLMLAAYVSVPAIGLLCSLQFRAFMAAWWTTILIGIAIPWGGFVIGSAHWDRWLAIQFLSASKRFVLYCNLFWGEIWLVGAGLICLAVLHRMLVRRRFAFPRAGA